MRNEALDFQRHLIHIAHRDGVIEEWIRNHTSAPGIGPDRLWIEDLTGQDTPTGGVFGCLSIVERSDDGAEIAHPIGIARNGDRNVVYILRFAELLEGEEEERPVAAV